MATNRRGTGRFRSIGVPADLPALRGRFHIITCLDVLEHMDDDVEGLRAIAVLLAPGGQVVVTAPAYDWLWSGEDVISAHRRRYTRETLLRAARAAGFDVLFASYFFAERAAGRGGRRLGPAADVAPLARADEPGRAPGLARRRPARGDQRGGAPRRRRAPVAARGREPRLPPAAAGAIMNDDGNRWRPWRDRPLVFGAPTIGAAERDEVIACLESGWLGTGPRVAELERRLGAYLDAPAAVAVSSCSAALHLALTRPGSAAGLRGDHHQHDVLRDRQRHRPRRLRAGVRRLRSAHVEHRRRRRAPQDHAAHARDRPGALRGRPVRHRRARRRSPREHGLALVEDAAHALEATVDGRHCGTFGDFGCFSFYVTKSVTTVDGGLLVARDPRLADRLRRLALHGMSADAWRRYADDASAHYEVVEPGFKYNLTDLAAAIGLHQLDGVDDALARRRAVWKLYEDALAGAARCTCRRRPPPGTRHALHLFTCLVDDTRTSVTRDEVLARLHALRIGAGVHYRAVHLHPWYRRTHGERTGTLPNAEWVERAHLLAAAVGGHDRRRRGGRRARAAPHLPTTRRASRRGQDRLAGRPLLQRGARTCAPACALSSRSSS